MKGDNLMDALVLTKRIGNLLNEIMDLSQQMAEAVDRSDEVTVQMLISMRTEPLEKLKTAHTALQQQTEALAETEEGKRLAAALSGGQAVGDTEKMIAKQAAANARQYEKVVALERVLNQKIARDKSIFR